MSASVNDKIVDTRNAARPNSARATGTRTAGGTSLACDNLAGWPTASKVHFVTYQLDSSSKPMAGTQLDCSGIVTSNTIGSITVIDGTDLGNSVNDVVEMVPTAAWGQDLADALTNQHTRTGAHTGIVTDTITVTSGSTLPAGDIGTADIANTAVTADKLNTGAAQAYVATEQQTSSTSYADLATTTDSVTVIIGNNGLALVTIYVGTMYNTTATALSYASFAVSGANTISASDSYALINQSFGNNGLVGLGATHLLTGLTPGSTTFKMKYKVNSNTGGFIQRRIAVVPL